MKSKYLIVIAVLVSMLLSGCPRNDARNDEVQKPNGTAFDNAAMGDPTWRTWVVWKIDAGEDQTADQTEEPHMAASGPDGGSYQPTKWSAYRF